MQLEKMGAFFEARLDGYEAHMLKNIESAEEFYPFTARQLPDTSGASVLDLGCGTGLEMDWYFQRNPSAKVTGIDLAEGMLEAFRGKYPEKELHLICGSYFDVPFGNGVFDAAVSVESLHHFTKEEKIPLYTKLCKALKPDGHFILTDYFSLSDEEEKAYRTQLLRLKAEQGVSDDEFYHYDTPLTIENETQALLAAGFASVEVLGNWGATYTLKAIKGEKMKLTRELVQKDLNALPVHYKTGDVDRLIRRYVKEQADVSGLRSYILSEQQFHRIYYYVSLDQIKSVDQRMAFIHENLLLSDWWHTDQIISYVADLDFDIALRYAKGYIHAEDPFIRRWGYVLFISKLCKGHAEELLPLMHDDEHYYVQMAEAWLIAELAVHEPEAVCVWFQKNNLKYNINGKAIQKICDSFRVSDEWKAEYKKLRPELRKRR